MASTLRGSDRPLTDLYDVALLDLDGVVYIGRDAVPGVPRALASARKAGMRLAFVTNNAARPPDVVARHLTDLGIDAVAEEVVTSSQAAARYLAERLDSGARVLVVGTTGLEEALEEQGLLPVHDADGKVDAVAQGYSPDLDWHMLAEGAVAINRGVPWVATNVDPTVPSPRGPLPGNGSLVAALRHATGAEPVVTGKPDPTMHRESLLRSGAERPIVVGDRLDTDIEGANAVGCPSLLVLSGVTGPADLLRVRAGLRPTYLARDVSGLLRAHDEPAAVEGGSRCGRWEAISDQDGLRLNRLVGGSGDAPGTGDQAGGGDATRTGDAAEGGDGALDDADVLDALRALCAAAWADDAEGRTSSSGSGPSGAALVSPAGEGAARAAAEEAIRRLELGG